MDVLDLRARDGLTGYQEAWELQQHLHREVADGTRRDTLVVVEHHDVYTAGKRTASWDRPVDGTPVVDVDRGGRITWHGPGQLVVYPLVRLREPVDVVAYVRALERAVIDTCSELGLEAVRVDGRSGVWLPASTTTSRDRKVAAIGVRVAKGVTMHGLALNCDTDLAAFSRIVPCGIDDADVTSLTLETGRRVTVDEADARLRPHLTGALATVRADARTAVTGG
ncbi:lipoyl(octanoyl) transferase LipB [Cellulomonas bogoriensis]|uniref:Octanoyltransferase n=1 Tax=Cellulomonas bogoriensis 69B4 = DSM 16987 TaxID=1386082 RepID=A0A0A0C046_9CELL|nr:lipoyl(octanoyl) transferase LipB [Cellulomonas bogoriensis]KGM14043.1 octanoyltransferase [Cellulomonas bogoriensis 69B4 = DSM 16987]